MKPWLAALPLMSLLASGRATSAQAPTSGPNVQVSARRGDLVQVEPVIAVDPRHAQHMLVAAIGLRRPHDPDWQDHQTIALYRSADGGKTWTPRVVRALPDGWTAGDPWLAWPESRVVTLSAIAGQTLTRSGHPPARARLFLSRDGGLTWDSGGSTPFAPTSGEDHPVLAVGHSGGCATAYAVATHASSQEEGIDAVRLSSGCLAADTIAPLRPAVAQVNLGGAVVRGSSELVVTFHSMLAPRGLWAARLDTASGQWKVQQLRRSILPAGFTALAVDASVGRFAGRVYALWVEGEDESNLRVLSAWSPDGGATWSGPIQVHADSSPVVRTLPTIAVAPDGAVGVIWQDRRRADGRECSDLYGTISVDGGATFLPEVRISTETSCAGYELNGAAAGRFRLGGGDYQGLVGTGPRAFQAVWSDSRTGRYQIWTAPLTVR